MKISIQKKEYLSNDIVTRTLSIKIKNYEIRIGFYRWPWIGINRFVYRTNLAGIIDCGITPWLMYVQCDRESWREHGLFRFLFCAIAYRKEAPCQAE